MKTLRQIRHQIEKISRVIVTSAREKRKHQPRVQIVLIVRGQRWA